MFFFKSVRNQVGLSQQKFDQLLALFGNLRDFGRKLHDNSLRYVLDDGPDAVLGDLAAVSDAAGALHLRCSVQYGPVGGKLFWDAFLETIEPVDCRFYLRLGKVFEAAARRLPADRFFCEYWFDGARWLEILLQESTRTAANVWSSEERKTAISGPLIEAMLKADGRTVNAFVTAAFREPRKRNWGDTKMRGVVLAIADLGKTYAAHRDLLTEYLRQGAAHTRLIAVENLARSEAPPEAFLEELVLSATDSAKLLRESAEILLRRATQTARPLLEQVAGGGERTAREHAVRLLGRFYGAAVRPVLERIAESEKSEAVRDVIAGVLKEVDAGHPAAEVLLLEPPAETPIALHPPVTPALRGCLQRLFDEYNEHVVKHNADLAAPNAANRHIYPRKKLPALDGGDLYDTCRLLEKGGPLREVFAKTLTASNLLWGDAKGTYRAWLEHPDCQLIHVVRFLVMIGSIRAPVGHSTGIEWRVNLHIELFRRSHTPKVTLCALAEAIRAVDLPDDILTRTVLESYFSIFDWEPEAVWPFFLNKTDLLEQAFDPAAGDWQARYQRVREFNSAIRILAKFPHVPPSLVGKLWDLAIGPAKADRMQAQRVAIKLPDLQDRLYGALSARSFQTRAVAAEWLGRIGDHRAIAALHAAAKREKHDVALDEMLTALERLDEPIESYLDRDRLAAEAEKGLRKGTPPALEWFPWKQLPQVHWQDTGAAVPAAVTTWLVVQSFKLKSSEAGPLLRRYCDMMRPADRAELGQSVLGAWLDQDLKRKYTDAECRAKAQQQAPVQWQQYQQHLQWYQTHGHTPPTSFQQTVQQIEDSLFHGLQREVGSAAAEKGILAVAGACCDALAVGPVQKYLKDWYGIRAAQCKALIAMLSTIDHPSATQFLLSIANRFRTKGIREEAERHVNALAERKGWTLDELADRTLPTAGFDGDGTLPLSFGPRQFQLRVTPKLEAVLTDADGKALKALPAPRKDDDEAQAKAAKKTFSAAKAELKKFAGLQTTRLYEAMCTQRTWTADDWRAYLMSHPLMKFLCQRLVWAACDGDRTRSTFRPLDDGTLTDYEDNEVRLPAEAKLRIAHSCQVSAEAVSAWLKHLADYSVAPLFTQLGRETYTLPEEKRKETAIDDFCGHMIEAFKLRSLATKFGYTRGQAQDGGWFFDYIKNFPGMGLRVVLNFSGNGLPEENRAVALKDISFQQVTAAEGPMMQMSGGMALDEVPAVLLSECYNDLRTVAATGTGYDPQWEKKVQ